MDAPKCKICAQTHWGLCPGNQRARAFPKKRGRPSIGAKPMTAAQRRQRSHAKGDERKA